MLKGHAFIVSLFLFGTVLSAAPHITRNYANRYFSTRDGLAQMQVMCAFQDKDGYIWFGTKGGVSRWDGVSFKNYGVDEGVPTGNILEIGEAGNSIVIMMLHHILLLEPSGRIKYINIPEGYSVSSNCFIPIGNNRILFPGIANIHNQVQFGIIYNFQTGKASRLKLFSENVYKCMHDTLITETGLFTYSKLNFKKILNFPFRLWGKSDLWIEGENLFLGNKSTGKLYKYKKHNP
jgi:ligand-binding sensor domain-containing protein